MQVQLVRNSTLLAIVLAAAVMAGPASAGSAAPEPAALTAIEGTGVDMVSNGTIPTIRIDVDPACRFSPQERQALIAAYAQAARTRGYQVDPQDDVVVRIVETGVRANGIAYIRVRVEGIGLTLLDAAEAQALAATAGAAAMRIVAALHGSL